MKAYQGRKNSGRLMIRENDVGKYIHKRKFLGCAGNLKINNKYM